MADATSAAGFRAGAFQLPSPRNGMCYECGWQDICEDCTYFVPGRGRRCVDCSEVPGCIFPPSRRDIIAVRNHTCDLVDVMMGIGLAHSEGPLDELSEELVRLAST